MTKKRTVEVKVERTGVRVEVTRYRRGVGHGVSMFLSFGDAVKLADALNAALDDPSEQSNILKGV